MAPIWLRRKWLAIRRSSNDGCLTLSLDRMDDDLEQLRLTRDTPTKQGLLLRLRKLRPLWRGCRRRISCTRFDLDQMIKCLEQPNPWLPVFREDLLVGLKALRHSRTTEFWSTLAYYAT
jgi:hypothetical protein